MGSSQSQEGRLHEGVLVATLQILCKPKDSWPQCINYHKKLWMHGTDSTDRIYIQLSNTSQAGKIMCILI